MSAADVLIPRTIEWRECTLAPGEMYHLRAIIEGTSDTVDRAALIVFEDARAGAGLSLAEIGAHIRLHTAPGMNRVDRLFTVDNVVGRFGLRTVEDPNTARIRTLTIERVDQSSPGIDHFFSFDVEAGIKEVLANPLDARVWCRTAGGEYGIRRICGILDEHKVAGNFLVDFGSCAREGERQLRSIVDFLMSSGHEVHMHLHANKVADHWGVPHDDSFRLEASTYEMLRRLLDFTVRSYQRYVGRDPRLFRSGSYMMSPALILAAGSLGIEALSNVRDNVSDPLIGGDRVAGREPFRWENGVVEIPVDVSSPERGSLESYLRKQTNAVMRKATHRTCNVVMHSWSLLRQNQNGILDEFAPDHIERFHQMCDLARTAGRTWGYGEYLDRRGWFPGAARLSHIAPAATSRRESVSVAHLATCNVCDTTFSRTAMEADRCPSCGSRAPHRQLRFAFDTHGSVFDGRIVATQDAEHLNLLRQTTGAAHLFLHHRGVTDQPAKAYPVECFVAVPMHDNGTDAAALIDIVARLLRTDGVFVSTAPTDDPAMHSEYGTYPELLARHFDVSSVPSLDPVLRAVTTVYFCYPKDCNDSGSRRES